MITILKTLPTFAFFIIITLFHSLSRADNTQINEIHYQYGDIMKSNQGGANEAKTNSTGIITFQHASSWEYGENFYFFDYLNYGQSEYERINSLNQTKEIYGEWYSSFSLSKLSNINFRYGAIRDIGLIAGFNFPVNIDTIYYLPGIRLSLDLPNFTFSNLDFMAYIQNNASNIGNGISIREENSWMVDFNWSYNFKILQSKWILEGHIEYVNGSPITISQNNSITNSKRESWILAQPQLRYDISSSFDIPPNRLYIGLEFQYWKNKLGDKSTDEKTVLLLIVWHL